MKLVKNSYKTGISFGLTSGIITTLGLMVGLNASSGMKSVVIGGILTIAIADSFSDALGIYSSEESDAKNSYSNVLEASAFTFFTKLVVALSFIIAFLVFDVGTAVRINLVYGLFLLGMFSYFIARIRSEKPLPVITKHLLISVIVIVLTHYAGYAIAYYVG